MTVILTDIQSLLFNQVYLHRRAENFNSQFPDQDSNMLRHFNMTSRFLSLMSVIVIACLCLTTQAIPYSDEVPLEDSSLTTTTTSWNPKDSPDETLTTTAVQDSLAFKDTEKKHSTTTTTNKPSLIRVPLVPVSSQSAKSDAISIDNSNPKLKFNSKESPAILYDENYSVVLKSPSSPVVPYTVTNEVMNPKATGEDMEFLCHHYYKDEFVVSAQVQEQGCQLECVLLKSSGIHGSGFFDTSVTKVHTINEGQSCDKEVEAYKCVNGSCIEPPETGKAFIKIINGTFERRDEDSDSDPYVKVYLDQKYLMKTKVIENNNNPVWMTAFLTPIMTSDTQLGFIVFDKDPVGEELLITVQTSVSLILALGLNGTATCAPPGSPKGQLCYEIRWYPELIK